MDHTSQSGRPPSIILHVEKQDKRSFICYKNLGRTFFGFVTIQAFARQTDRQTDGWLSHG